jgi:hypothetical protein
MTIVYAHRIKDGRTLHMVVASHKRTAAAIRTLRGEIIPETAERVPDAAIDREGRYNPEAREI